MDAVNQAYQILEKHNGCFLADVVGLGKTIIAILIARQFFYKNGYPDYRSKILLVIPPALIGNWETTLSEFKIEDAFTIITNGSLDNVRNYAQYDMVIIDESHKFRNSTSQAYQTMQIICKTPTTKDTAKKVLLLSATPLNNRPNDLYNQILLFQDGNQSSLGFSLSGFFNQIDKEHKEIRKLRKPKDIRRDTIKLYEKIREAVIEPLTVRRTRTDLSDNDRYKEDLKNRGITFPNIQKPTPIYYQLSPDLNKLFDETLLKIDNKEQKTSGLCYTRYRILNYLIPEKRQQYDTHRTYC